MSSSKIYKFCQVLKLEHLFVRRTSNMHLVHTFEQNVKHSEIFEIYKKVIVSHFLATSYLSFSKSSLNANSLYRVLHKGEASETTVYASYTIIFVIFMICCNFKLFSLENP